MSQYNPDYSTIKKPGQDRPLTEEEAKEWIKCATDPFYFMTNYCYVVGNRGKVLYEPRCYQREMVQSILDNRHLIALAGRQCGKSISMALYALHQTIFNQSFTVGFTSFTAANCKDVLQRYKTALESLPEFLAPEVVLYNRTEVAFTNGSQIYVQVTSENALRGRTNNLAIIDEFAFVKNSVAEDFYTSLLPSLEGDGAESNTKVVFISTPNGTVNKFAELYFGAEDGSSGFGHYKVDHTKIPGRTEEWKSSMLKKMSREKYLQEFECHFLSDSGTLVNSTILESIKTPDIVETHRGEFDIFVDCFRGRKLGVACDVSEGVSKDNHCIQVMDLDTFDQVAEFANNTMSISLYFKEIVTLLEYLKERGAKEIYYSVEANSIGQGIIRLIENSQEDILTWATMIHDISEHGVQKRIGMLTTASSKRDGCATLKDLIETGRYKINSLKLLNELKVFVKTGTSFAAESGYKDDRVMASVILMNMLPQIGNYEDSVYEHMNDVDMDDETWGIVF